MLELLKNLLAPVAIVSIAIFFYNRCQEERHLRVSCLILLIEVNRHKTWLATLLNDLTPTERQNALNVISTADFVNNDWNKIKFDPMFARVSVEEFNIIALHYNEMFSFQKTIEKCYQQNEAMNEKVFAEERLVFCKRAYNIIYRLAGSPTGYSLEELTL